MSCVSTNSKEFKETVSRLDVHPNNLEIIVYKYLNNEDRFPTDEEIMTELNGKAFRPSEAAIKYIVKRGLGKKEIFSNFNSARGRADKLKRLLPEESVSLYRDASGKFVLSIGDMILDDLPFSIGENTISEVLSSLDRNNPEQMFIEKMVNLLGRDNIHIELGNIRKDNTTMKDVDHINEDLLLAVYNGTTGRITVDAAHYKHYFSLLGDLTEAQKQSIFRSTILHEMVHQMMSNILTTDRSNLSKEEAEFRDTIEEMYTEAKSKIAFRHYGFENTNEFIAETLSDWQLRRDLAKTKAGKVTLWDKFIDAVVKFLNKHGFNIKSRENILEVMMSATDRFMAFREAENTRMQEERAQMNEMYEDEDMFMDAPPDDFFNPSSEGYRSLKSRLLRNANGYSDGPYKFERRTYKGESYMVLNIPTNRVSLEEAINKGNQMLSKLGFEPTDFKFDDSSKTYRGKDYIKVRALTLKERKEKTIEAERSRLAEIERRNAEEEARLLDLEMQRDELNKMTQAETDLYNRIGEIDPYLAQQLADGEITLQEADELFRDGMLKYSVAQNDRFKEETFTNHSGGAAGADSYWGEIGEKYGVTSKHYHAEGSRTPKGNTPVSKADLLEADSHLAKANETLKRRFPTSNEYVNNLLRRNWQQVKNADEVFAVSTIKSNLVEGGTGWAVQMAIDEGKPVHVFDQSAEKWYTYRDGSWVETETPSLTNNFAGIGTRGINEAGKGAIEEVYAKTQQSSKSQARELEKKEINIYAGTNENTHLSNFANRPFTNSYDSISDVTGEIEKDDEYTGEWLYSILNEDNQFQTVEGAFQAAKIAFSSTYREEGEFTNEGLKLIKELKTANGARARSIGRSIKGLDTKLWDSHSSSIMKVLLKNSFVQNPEALKQLLDTGDAELTHIQDRGKWGKEFPRLLMEVRSELGEGNSTISPETDARVQVFGAEFEGGYNSLVGIVPEPLLSKVEDYIMSGGQFGLSEADAQQFLDYAETAYAEQETTNQEQQPIKKENKTYMERAVTITQQIDNLNNCTALSVTEVRHAAEQAVHWISDHITEIQETPGLAEKIYGEQFKDKDFASMSRAEVVRTIGPDAIIAMCKEKFSPENTDYENFDTIEKAEVITDNWGAIMMLASDVFLSVEDFSIVSSKDGKTSEVNEDLVADADNFNNSNMEGDVLENEGDLQEHWQVETKTLDVFATMSQMVKQALTKCYLLDKDGNNITSEFGINERVDAREATNSILRWTQGALNLEQMIAKLQEKSDSNPWVRQIIDRLSDTSGKEADFQGQFFGTFCKHFQPYSVVIEENGRYKSIQVNESPALSEAMAQVTTQYKIGEHPLFTTEGINKGAFKELKSAFEELSKYNHQGYDLTNTETRDEAARTLGYVSNLLGYYVTPEIVAENLNKDTFKRMYSALRYITNSLEKNLDNATYEPFKFGSKDGINGNTREFLKPITDHLEDIAVSAFYDSGKMYQSYITPSYTSKLFQKFGQTGQAFDDFIMAEYGNMPWFHTGNNIERGWRNAWLKSLATDSKAREIFKHKVQLNFNKHNYMRNMSDMEYALSLFTEYFSENASEKQTRVPAWFRVPMLGNKPSSEFIRFYSERGANYREALTNGFKMIFDQELSRIQTVEMRNLSESDPRFIKNFDSNGKKFMFLDFMNEYLTGNKKSSELGKLIRQKLDGQQIDEARLNELAKEAIMQTMETRAESVVATWEAQGILKGAEKVANIGTTEEEIRENLKNFVWNDTFAAMNIMQLTITDIAFYEDAGDLQKRLAQIHAPGVRGNAKATDYEGRPVTDGNFRTIKLTDFDTFISNIIDNVSVVFDRRIASAPESEKAALRALKDSLVGKNGEFRKINVADAQGYSSPTSYRKKALVFGKWNRQAEEIYQKLKKGTYTYNDLKVAFQPLKPFVYSQITKDAGVEGAPLGKMKVPVQYKNSEYLLIMADAILQGENTGRPNLLRAIFEVMEESHYDKKGNYKTDGIDTAQFESAVKSGLMGRINLNDLVNDPNGESIAKARMEAAIYEATPKEITEVNPETGVEEAKTIYERTGLYNNSAVDTVPFEDYCLQQEVPEHFKEHEQAHGSQLRYIIVSELETSNYLGEPVTYNLEGKQVTAQEFKAEYENTIAENIQESIDELAEELSLNDLDNIKDRNIALSKILQREILSSPRYGVDLLQACSVDENGRFRIPLGDPIQSKRVEQLINSIIKNRVNKQKLPGGPVVQVTNFGTSKELNIRFKDKTGNLLKTKTEYEKENEERETRGLVQSVLSRSLSIKWQGQEIHRGLNEGSQEGQLPSESHSTRSSRLSDDVTRRISEVSTKIDEELDKRGIRHTKQAVRHASAQEFHDAIIKAKKENPNGWMVDAHEISDYENNLCLLTEDGKSGIAITKDGDIISVFSSVARDSRLEKLMQMAIAAGGKALDCYYLVGEDGTIKGLPDLCARFGFKVDATTPFNEEFAPDDYRNWESTSKVGGVAAMSLKNINSIENYSLEHTSGIESATEFADKNTGYDEMLNFRNSKIPKFSLQNMSYEDYIRENQAGIAYFEVFAPIYSNQLFTQFADKNGVINIQALEMLDPDLLKMIGYRI